MSFETTRQLIAAKLATIEPGFPVEWEGGKPIGATAAKGPWGRWKIQQGSTTAIAIGATEERGTGLVWLQVFIPREKGTKAATLAADAMKAALNRTQLRDEETGTVVTFRTTGMQEAGEEAGFLQMNLSCMFTRDTYPPPPPPPEPVYEYYVTTDQSELYVTTDSSAAYVFTVQP